MRPPRFRLRTLMIAVAVVGLALESARAFWQLDEEGRLALLFLGFLLCSLAITPLLVYWLLLRSDSARRR